MKIILILNPKHNSTPAISKKINVIPAQMRTNSLHGAQILLFLILS